MQKPLFLITLLTLLALETFAAPLISTTRSRAGVTGAREVLVEGPHPTEAYNANGACIPRLGCYSAAAWGESNFGSFAFALESIAEAEPRVLTINAVSNVVLSFVEQFILSSDTLPAGSFVDVGFTQRLEGDFSGSGTGDYYGWARSLVMFSSEILTFDCHSFNLAGRTLDPCRVLGPETSTRAFRLGDVVTIHAMVDASAWAFHNASATVDYRSTAKFFIHLPEGVTMTTASGATYAPPGTTVVPEPGFSLPLALSGLAMLLRRRAGKQTVRARTQRNKQPR